MVITEIFRSIQGEGTRAGLPCIFVRLTGCNLRCTWCDTAYAFHGGRKMSVDEVMAQVAGLSGLGMARPCLERPDSGVAEPRDVLKESGLLHGALPIVELTGGEPL